MTENRLGIERLKAALDQVAQELPQAPLPCSSTARQVSSRRIDFRRQEALEKLFLGEGNSARRGPQWVFVAAAVFCHILVFSIVFPEITYRRPELGRPVRSMVVHNYTPPPPPPREKRRIVRELTKKLPLPDMTPNDPEPIIEATPLPDPPPVDPEIEFTIGTPETPPKSGPLIPGVAGVSEPELVPETRVEPEYPELARRARIEGQVVLQLIVRKDGTVGGISILSEPEVQLGFSEAAIAAVEQWRYRPALQNQRAVDVFVTVVVTFSFD